MSDDREGPVLVTGASTGIGRAICEALASKGTGVFAGARKSSDLESLGRIPHVTAIRLDVTNDEDVTEAVATVRRAGWGLRGLVNNAGVVSVGPVAEASDEELGRVFGVNVFGVQRMTRAFLPPLLESRGRVVNLSSIAVYGASRWLGTYSASKHALEGYSRTLREELADKGVSVSVVEPGTFHSRVMENFFDTKGQEFDDAWKNSWFRAEMKETFERFRGAGGMQRGAPDPEPTPVVEAVVHALFSRQPKPLYIACSPEERSEVTSAISEWLQEVNAAHAGVVPRDQH